MLDSDDAETRLMKELINNLQAECEMTMEGFQQGREPFVLYYESLHRLTDERLEFHSAAEDQRRILTENLKIARAMEDSAKHAVERGVRRAADLYQSRSFRIKAELALLRFEKAQAQKQEDLSLDDEFSERNQRDADAGSK